MRESPYSCASAVNRQILSLCSAEYVNCDRAVDHTAIMVRMSPLLCFKARPCMAAMQLSVVVPPDPRSLEIFQYCWMDNLDAVYHDANARAETMEASD
jgi:hypothetical protein